MSNNRILVVEDDKQFAEFISNFLTKAGFEVVVVHDGIGFLRAEAADDFDCIILDLTLPDEDGIVLARKLRTHSQIPIIVMTGRDGLDDKLASFDVGADDYIIKPFDPRELEARVQVMVRRADNKTNSKGNDVVLAGNLRVNRKKMEIRDQDDRKLDLTTGEFTLFWTILKGEGDVLSRATLIDACSTGSGPETERAVDILISRIRKKIGRECIETVSGAGYKLGQNYVQA